jgi:hypothetical protein
VVGGLGVTTCAVNRAAWADLGPEEENIRQVASEPTPPYYYAARNNGYTVPRAASFAGKALALAQDVTQGIGPPHAPTPASRVPDREGRTAAPRRALPRTVRSRLECRLFYVPHSMVICSKQECI